MLGKEDEEIRVLKPLAPVSVAKALHCRAGPTWPSPNLAHPAHQRKEGPSI